MEIHYFALPGMLQEDYASVGVDYDIPCSPKEGRWDKVFTDYTGIFLAKKFLVPDYVPSPPYSILVPTFLKVASFIHKSGF